MCGIIGVYSLKGIKTELADFRRMLNSIGHRGPDGDGVFMEGPITLGHKRLSIIDTSDNGAQPMTSNDGKWTLVFNGCIYNYLELKKDLIEKGAQFKSSSDTEVIAEGIAMYGIDYIKKFNGMFAIGAWDNSNKALYLCRDRFGVKPLYYYHSGDALVFSSEIKGILKYPEYKIGVNKAALNEYFTFQNLFSHQSLFKGVWTLPPANIVRIDKNTKEVKHNSWWDYNFVDTDETMNYDSALDKTKELFEKAVSRQMVADVPVGSYLSGGMDSGSITAIASKQVDELATFTCGFDMSTVSGFEANYDERRAAELMASIFGTEHYEQVIGSSGMVRSLEKVVTHLEEPRVGMSYPNYYISRLASKFVKVCMQGTGGDELYGGYPWRYYRIFDSVGQQSFLNQYYDFWQRLVNEDDKSRLFQPNIHSKMDMERPRKTFDRVFTFNEKLKYNRPEDHIQNSLYFEIKTFLPGLLMVGDKLSMANGLEERYPFLDNDLVDFAQKIPIRHKLGNLEKEIRQIDENMPKKKSKYREFDDGKNVLRKAMVDFMPDEILNRKKQGFSAPDENWYRNENAAFVEQNLLSKNSFIQSIIQPNFINQILQEHNLNKKNHRLLIWSFLNMETWGKTFLLNE
ncbi:MAG: asparagine synthase (glutamine-hydrolyzing) [Flavobacteriales bacterium]|nr:asparagine synthase (glutamine-hydrolyzing) [Flavobacteriales bacterium]